MKSFLFLVLCVSFGPLMAQNPLQASSAKLRNLDRLSYSVITRHLIFENQETDTLRNYEKVAQSDKFTGSHFMIKEKSSVSLYAGDQLVVLYPKDSTYKAEKPRGNQYIRSLTQHWAGQFQKFLSYPDRLKSFPDTLINGKESYHLRYYQKKDSLVGDYLTYNRHDIYIDKASLLPSLIISDTKMMYNDLPSQITSVYAYQNYDLNPVDFPILSPLEIPGHYQDINTKPVAEKPALVPLKAGTPAPDFVVKAINGEELRLDNLRSHVVLLNFTSVVCPHAYSSMGGLRRIEEKFRDKNLKIISIYDNVSSPEDKVRHMLKTFHMDYVSAVLNGDSLAQKYHSEGYPNFYIIDTNGRISYYAGGYSDRIEKQLTEQLEGLLGTR